MPGSDLVPLNRGLLAGKREREDIQAHTASKTNKNSKRLPNAAREHHKGLFEEVKTSSAETVTSDLGDVEEQAVARRDMLRTKHMGGALSEKNVVVQKEIENMQNMNYIKLYEKAVSDNERLVAEKQQLDELKEKHARLANENAKLAEIISGKADVRAEIDHHERFREAVQTSLNDNKKLQVKLGQVTEENQKLQFKLGQTTEESKVLQTKLGQITEENKVLQAKLAKITDETRELVDSHGKLKIKVETLKSSLQDKDSTLQKANEYVKNNTSSMRVLETQIEDLRDQLEQQIRKHKTDVKGMTATLEDMRKHNNVQVDLLQKTQQENQALHNTVLDLTETLRLKDKRVDQHTGLHQKRTTICCDILKTCQSMSRLYNSPDLAEALQESIETLENLE